MAGIIAVILLLFQTFLIEDIENVLLISLILLTVLSIPMLFIAGKIKQTFQIGLKEFNSLLFAVGIYATILGIIGLVLVLGIIYL